MQLADQKYLNNPIFASHRDGWKECCSTEKNIALPMKFKEYLKVLGCEDNRAFNIEIGEFVSFTEEELNREGYYIIRDSGRAGWLSGEEFKMKFKLKED